MKRKSSGEIMVATVIAVAWLTFLVGCFVGEVVHHVNEPAEIKVEQED